MKISAGVSSRKYVKYHLRGAQEMWKYKNIKNEEDIAQKWKSQMNKIPGVARTPL
jgi:hypothetical protein